MEDNDWWDLCVEINDLAEEHGIRCFYGDEFLIVRDRDGNVMLKIFSNTDLGLAQMYVKQLREHLK
jgi:hypothetical protein